MENRNTIYSHTYRKKVYESKNRHDEHKLKDKERKGVARYLEAEKRKNSEAKTLLYREKERLRKARQRQEKKDKEKAAAAENGVNKQLEVQKIKLIAKMKNKARRLKRKSSAAMDKVKFNFSRSRRLKRKNSERIDFDIHEVPPEARNSSTDESYDTSSSTPLQSSANSTTPLQAVWDAMTPNSKKKAKMCLQDCDRISPSTRSIIREEIGVNLSKRFEQHIPVPTPLEEAIKEFFERPDVCRIAPDTKKVVTDPDNPKNSTQVHYRLGYLCTLHAKFMIEYDGSCVYETFTRHVPYYVKKPGTNDWGTCLCMTCVNPEMKIEKLYHMKKITQFVLEEKMRDQQNYQELLTLLDTIEYDENETITFPEWQKVMNPMNNGKTKISRKVTRTLKYKAFLKELKDELAILCIHLHTAHMQFRAFKAARVEAKTRSDTVTLQIDWSENVKMTQVKGEKGAYYYDFHVSLHCIYEWTESGEQSHIALSDCTDHSAPAVFASLKPILEELVESGKKKINIVSDSPTSQYRNRNMFWYLQQFAEEKVVSIVWIYLEHDHGKGVPDGIGAVGKRAIKDLISYQPDDNVYTAEDLVRNNLNKLTPSIQYHIFDVESVKEKSSQLPLLQSVKGTGKLHEVRVMNVDGKVKLTMKENSSMEEKEFTLRGKKAMAIKIHKKKDEKANVSKK